MKMRTLRRIQKTTSAPRTLRALRRRSNDPTVEAEPALPPEAIFDRVTGPWLDEET
ncbi:MAG TPA: hypothetical protein VGM88_03445 [Kofleriaceae bacterium]|jgi:hypothetical protein